MNTALVRSPLGVGSDGEVGRRSAVSQVAESLWCGGGGFLGEPRASFHPASQVRFTASHGECPYTSVESLESEYALGRSQPNKRVKLAAPALISRGFRSAGRLATIPFVNILIRRRSLRAFR